MRWKDGRRSGNVQDRRGGGGVAIGGAGAVILVILALLMGGDPEEVLQQIGAPATSGGAPGQSAATDELAEFVAVVLAYTEDTWNGQFARSGGDYPEPQLVLFTGSVQSACGYAQAAVGPFYCTRDSAVYIDLSFYRDLREKLGAPGDFAQAYVIAHEVGHHVQNVTGVMERARAGSGADSDAVRVELQADCYAGVWAHDADLRGVLEPGDIEEALNAASAIGDDRLQQQSRGQVVPESFTHGTSEQRVRWFRRGFETGDPAACDTFSARSL